MLLSRNYDWAFLQDLPLSMLEELVKAAADHDLEKQLLPIWLVHYAIKTLQGGKTMSFEEMLRTVRGGEQGAAAPSSKMTAEEIMKEFAPIIAADKLRREKRGKGTRKESSKELI